MRNLKLFSLGIAMLITFLSLGQCSSLSEQAKQKTITGVVTDDSGLPLPGANVVVKKTNRATQTDFDGKYTIQAKAGEKILFQFTGMNTVQVKVKKDSSIINATVTGGNITL